ncbi:MAG: hypothetical protein K0R11_1363 [Acidimicrobiales bacterium]|jgi:hypothetical protein|nr:hypothetical protein [Acidimicrobiales bacterium]
MTGGYRHAQWRTEEEISLSALLLGGDQYSAAHYDVPRSTLAVPVSVTRILRPLRLVAASLVALFSLTLLASAASAQAAETTPYGNTVPTVGGTSIPAPETTEATVLGNVVENDMAFTGGDVVGLVAIGGGAVAVGTALVLAARKRRSLELA